MAFKRELSISSSLQPTYFNPSQKHSLKFGCCQVCNDKANIIHYGVLSCQSCKTFFRRNAFCLETDRPCLFNKSCKINIQTRRLCSACRFAKCILVGMDKDLIRKINWKKSKNSSLTKRNDTKQTISKKLITAPQLPTLDLLQHDRSLLLNSEWTLISNIVHAHDTNSNVSQIVHNINSLFTLPAEMHSNIINPLEIVSQMYISMQSFIRSSPDFRILTLNEQTSLLARNSHGINGLYAAFFFRNSGILYNIKCLEAFINIYGSDMMLLANKINERLDPDSTLIKLILMVFAFSSNCLIINTYENLKRDSLLYGTFRLLGSQNVYVELLWKYMIYRYGYNESIIRFSRLMQTFLLQLTNMAIVHANNEAHQKMVADVIEKTKQSLSINDNEPSPLWGKT